MTDRGPTPGTRIAGHRLVSLPDEPIRVWQTLTTIVCRADRHDTHAAYGDGCRCPAAVRANSHYAKRIRTRRNVIVDADLAAKQLRALAAIGHSLPHIATQVGVTKDALMNIRSGHRRQIKRATARNIESYYRSHRAVPGTSARSRTEAARHGWTPPSPADLHLVDEVKVQRARAGLMAVRDLNAAERLAYHAAGETVAS